MREFKMKSGKVYFCYIYEYIYEYTYKIKTECSNL